MTEERNGVDRRQFLRRAAVTGAAAVWAAPLIRTVAATPAFAQSQVSPDPDACYHSINVEEGKLRGCMETCKEACGGGGGDACNDICHPACHDLSPGNNQCISDNYCVADCYECVNGEQVFTC